MNSEQTAELRLVTLWQPWASLMVWRAKRNETRGWNSHFRGRLAIHSGSNFPLEARQMCEHPTFYAVLKARLRDAFHENYGRDMLEDVPVKKLVDLLPLSAVLGLGDMVKATPTTQKEAEPQLFAPRPLPSGTLPPYPEREFGNYEPGRYFFTLERLRPLKEPVLSVNGKRGIWTPDPVLHDAIVAADMGWEAYSDRFSFRADGRALCPVCRAPYMAHPPEPELTFQGQPYLNRLCTGEAVKL